MAGQCTAADSDPRSHAHPYPTPVPNVNLALNVPTTVSSALDAAHGGAQAVDGNLATTWQTARASGKKKLPAEWITLDLGGVKSIGRIVLEWDAYYAKSYSLQVSSDGNSWTTVFSTTGGNGGNDTIPFGPTQARYVRLSSTAWNSSTLRNWLREFKVY